MSKVVALIVLAGTVLCGSIPDLVFADDAADEQAKQVATQFINAMKSKDLDAVMKISGVPWFDAFEGRIIKDRSELKNTWQEKLRDLDPSQIPDHDMYVEAYAKFREWKAETGDDDTDAMLHRSHAECVAEFDKVLGKSGWIVQVERKGHPDHRQFILLRALNRTIEVVGGPSGTAYFFCGSWIPANVRTILQKADRFELISLDPTVRYEKSTEGFHGWKVLGKTAVNDAAMRKKLVTGLKQGAEESSGQAAGCFRPRHGIRVTHEGQTADFVICFECDTVLLFVGEETEDSYQTTGSPQPIFDEVLKAAGVPLPENAKKGPASEGK